MSSEKEYLEFAKQKLDGHRETLRGCSYFECGCCGKQKRREEGAGVHLYKTEDEMLLRAMKDPNGQRKVATYVLCLECADSLPEQTIQQNVTRYLGRQGLFGNPI